MAETCKQDFTLDPFSLLLSHNSSSIVPMRLTTTESYFMERGPRYDAYAELRESKLRMKKLKQQQEEDDFAEEFEEEPKITPQKKQVRFKEKPVLGHRPRSAKSASVLAQSVPDFSTVLRKENRKPANALPTMIELTPPSKTKSKIVGVSGNARGSVSASAGEKRGNKGGLMARKSYASIEDLRGMSSGAANAIARETRRSARVSGKSAVLRYREF